MAVCMILLMYLNIAFQKNSILIREYVLFVLACPWKLWEFTNFIKLMILEVKGLRRFFYIPHYFK